MSVSALALVAGALAAGCGGGSSSNATSAPSSDTASTTGSSTGNGRAALTAEAQSAASGDIPDNQVFLTFANAPEGYSMKYPEGWAQRGNGARVSFQDKNNLVRVDVVKGSSVSVASASADMQRLQSATPSLRFDPPTSIPLGGTNAVKVVYSTESAPNPVTGKRVTLVVDRYYVPGPGKTAVVDLGTPQGVDNVDAYRLMIESFRWK